MRPENLHDRATRGEELTEMEQAVLAEWYAELERDESQTIFGVASPPNSVASDNVQIAALHQQIDSLLNQLTEKTKHLQQVMEQNKILQEEVNILRERVAQEIGIATA